MSVNKAHGHLMTRRETNLPLSLLDWLIIDERLTDHFILQHTIIDFSWETEKKSENGSTWWFRCRSDLLLTNEPNHWLTDRFWLSQDMGSRADLNKEKWNRRTRLQKFWCGFTTSVYCWYRQNKISIVIVVDRRARRSIDRFHCQYT
jgi:hypothetical protein